MAEENVSARDFHVATREKPVFPGAAVAPVVALFIAGIMSFSVGFISAKNNNEENVRMSSYFVVWFLWLVLCGYLGYKYDTEDTNENKKSSFKIPFMICVSVLTLATLIVSNYSSQLSVEMNPELKDQDELNYVILASHCVIIITTYLLVTFSFDIVNASSKLFVGLCALALQFAFIFATGTYPFHTNSSRRVCNPCKEKCEKDEWPEKCVSDKSKFDNFFEKDNCDGVSCKQRNKVFAGNALMASFFDDTDMSARKMFCSLQPGGCDDDSKEDDDDTDPPAPTPPPPPTPTPTPPNAE